MSAQPLWNKGELVSGQYVIDSLIGRGGMSEVYEARDSTLGRHVAIKALMPKFDVGFLKQEARTLAAFSHPALVTVHAIGVHNNVHYMVMERLHGTSMLQYMAKRSGSDRPLLDEALDVAIGLADGVAILHRAGLIHRDLKPGNVMLALGHRVVLMDFGLAIRAETMAEWPETCGTPPYMAPEIIEPARPVKDWRLVDLYSLGVILYELFAGEHPYGDAEQAVMLQRHLHDRVPVLRSRRPSCPQALSDLVLALMSKAPDDRPHNADMVAWALRQIRVQAPAAMSAGLEILIVEDEKDAAMLIERYVRTALPASSVRVARSGQSALTMARQQVPDLMLLDLAMPDMNGFELAMLLRASHVFDRCRIAVLSGRITEDDKQLLRVAGISDYIPKGGDAHHRILDVVRDLVRRDPRRVSGPVPAVAPLAQPSPAPLQPPALKPRTEPEPPARPTRPQR